MERVVPNFRAQVIAVDRVEKLLRKTSEALDAAGVVYAVVGGNAVAAWMATVDPQAVRATKDVDILVRRENLDAIEASFDSVGLTHIEAMGVDVFVDRLRPNPKSGVHLVFANERIRPHYTHATPDPGKAARVAAGFMVIDLPELVCMKLQAFRRIDQVHIEDLIVNGLIDANLVSKLPGDLRKRLQEIQETLGE